MAVVVGSALMLSVPQQAPAQNLVTLHLFGYGNNSYVDGDAPGELIQGADGRLYGTTGSGGTNGSGIVFGINRDGTGFTNLHAFSAVLGYDFKGYPTNTDGYVNWADYPEGLIQGFDGRLYGVAEGGLNGNGTIFSLNTNGTGFTLLHTFAASVASGQGGMNADGEYPHRLCQGSDGMLYGTTRTGGTNAVGVIFRLSTNGSSFTILRQFNGQTPNDLIAGYGPPPGGLIQGADGVLYGVTKGSGIGAGTVFKMNTDGGGFSYLYSFDGSATNGGSPNCRLLQGRDGRLYGTTFIGGINTNAGVFAGGGTIFAINTNGTGFSILNYCSTNIPNPNCGLVQASDGKLYGRTQSGGIFSLDTNGANFSVFSTPNYNSTSPLIQGNDGTLFGTFSRDINPPYLGSVFALPINLHISVVGSNVIVSWPTWATGYHNTLQTNGSVSANGWAALTNGILTVTNNFVVTNTMTGNAGFFRLH